MLMSAGAQGQEQQLFWLILIRSNPFSIIPSCIAIYALLEILDSGGYLGLFAPPLYRNPIEDFTDCSRDQRNV